MKKATKQFRSLQKRYGVIDVTCGDDSSSDMSETLRDIIIAANNAGGSLTLSMQSVKDRVYGKIYVYSTRPIADVKTFVKCMKKAWDAEEDFT